jgi:probable F420-dependent oxidoreductase
VQLPEVERDVRWPEYVAMARAAEEVGFDSIWLGDHLLYRGDGRPERGPWEAWTMLAGLAAVTETVRLGPLVACTSFHTPGMLAKQAAVVDEISGGRLVLALGAGWNQAEFDAFGIPFEARLGRFEESLPIVRRLFDAERVTFHGKHLDVENLVLLPIPAHRPPMMVGGAGPRLLRAALPHVDAWNTWYDYFGNTPEGFAKANEKVSEVAVEAGRSPDAILRSACVLIRLGASGERPEDPAAPAWTGSAEELGAGLRRMAEAGAHEVILVVDPINERSIRELGDVLSLLDQ